MLTLAIVQRCDSATQMKGNVLGPVFSWSWLASGGVVVDVDERALVEVCVRGVQHVGAGHGRRLDVGGLHHQPGGDEAERRRDRDQRTDATRTSISCSHVTTP